MSQRGLRDQADMYRCVQRLDAKESVAMRARKCELLLQACVALHVDWLSEATRLSDSSTWGSIKVIRPEETAISITLVPCYPLVVSREQCSSNQLQCQTAFTVQLVNGTRWKNQIILSLRSLRNAEPEETQEEESGALACMPDLGQTIPLELFVFLLARWLACLVWVWF